MSWQDKINKVVLCGFFLPLILFSGCIIPYGYETESQKVIGMRSDAEGKICEQIVRYDKKLNFIGIIGDGLFSPSYFCYSRYSAFAKDSEYAIWSLEHFPQLRWTRIEKAVPIPNSDRWITCEYEIQNINEVEVTLTIFSIEEGKIFRDTFSHVTRTPPRKAKTLFGFYIEYDKNLNHLTVHESDRVFQINILTGEKIHKPKEYRTNQ